MIMGNEEDRYLLASDAGYGFVAKLGDLMARNKNGKTLLTLPAGAKVLPPAAIANVATGSVVAVTTEGRMLVCMLSDLPELSKGKGNKIISIPSARVASREEYVVTLSSVAQGESLTLHCGQRHTTFKATDLDHYRGERGVRGNKLPRGFQRVDRAVPGEK